MLRTLLLILAALLIVLFFWGGNAAGDDAYITFRYSRNLAEGYGIVYNPGEAPTQGSTTMLFTLLVAAGIRIGLNPVTAAYLLSALGILVIAAALYLMPTLADIPKRIRWLLAGAVGIHVTLFQLISTGLETNFWTGLIFAGILMYELYQRDKMRRMLIALIAVSSAAILTRPESALIVAVWWLSVLRRQPRDAILSGLILGGIGLLYALGLRAYFGDVLPNSFYVKAGYSDVGLGYVLSFVLVYLINPLFWIGIVTIRKTMLLSVYVLLPLYVFTTPLIGGYFRFLNPATCATVFITAYGLYRLLTWKSYFRLVRVVLAAVAGFLLFVQPVASFLIGQLQGRFSVSQPSDPLIRTAQALASTDQPLVVAYADAGKIGYFARNVRQIDLVGLNDPLIARLAPTQGPGWVFDYVFARQPDLIAFYVDRDGYVMDIGHGVIGRYYSALFNDPRFKIYRLVGLVDYAPFDDDFYAAWFGRSDSSAYPEITAALSGVSVEVSLNVRTRSSALTLADWP